jgi:hypothetical protein
MKTRMKFDGTVLTEPGPVLRGELVTDYHAWSEEEQAQREGRPAAYRKVYALGRH